LTLLIKEVIIHNKFSRRLNMEIKQMRRKDKEIVDING
jgi:hypothetical protein